MFSEVFNKLLKTLINISILIRSLMSSNISLNPFIEPILKHDSIKSTTIDGILYKKYKWDSKNKAWLDICRMDNCLEECTKKTKYICPTHEIDLHLAENSIRVINSYRYKCIKGSLIQLCSIENCPYEAEKKLEKCKIHINGGSASGLAVMTNMQDTVKQWFSEFQKRS